MKPDSFQTNVTFRKFKSTRDNPGGDILALFPGTNADFAGNCDSYQHNGQHGAANYKAMIRATVAATPPEFTPLQIELEKRGYVFIVKGNHHLNTPFVK